MYLSYFPHIFKDPSLWPLPVLSSLSRCNLAPLEDFAEDVGLRSDFTTMNPSVIPRVYGGLWDERQRERFIRRLQQLNDSVLWIPAFMVKGGERHVETVNQLILKHKLKVRTAYPSLRLIHAVRGWVRTFTIPVFNLNWSNTKECRTLIQIHK